MSKELHEEVQLVEAAIVSASRTLEEAWAVVRTLREKGLGEGAHVGPLRVKAESTLWEAVAALRQAARVFC